MLLFLGWVVGIIGCAFILPGLIFAVGFGPNIGLNSYRQIWNGCIGLVIAGLGALMVVVVAPWISSSVFCGNPMVVLKWVGGTAFVLGFIVSVSR